MRCTLWRAAHAFLAANAMMHAIRPFEQGLIDQGKIISHRLPLPEIGKAIEILGIPDGYKAVIHP